jgi:hypothetical protein
MQLWRRYLEEYAESDGDPGQQVVVGAYHADELLGFLSRMLDRDDKYRETIDQRIGLFEDGRKRAKAFEDHLENASFSLYNHLNTLSRQFASGNLEAGELLQQIDEQVHLKTRPADQIERSAAALNSAFPLVSLMTLVLNQGATTAAAIRQVEQRFVAGTNSARTGMERLVNALYRIVEMTQVLVSLSDSALKEQVRQIAAHFQEEDREPDLTLKLRNGFCRFFELGHLLVTHLDEVL